jgi:carboxyl-terminal processing protease
MIQRPYDGSDEEYYRSAYLREEEDGDNITHTEEADSTRPKYKTDAGRTVYGGGGITPDYIVRYENLETYAARMRLHVFEYCTAYIDKNGADLRKQYQNADAKQFIAGFTVSETMMKEFIEFGKAKGVEFNKEEYDKDKDWLKAGVKAQIARTLYGNEGQFRAMLEVDPQFAKAIDLFPEARKIAGLR